MQLLGEVTGDVGMGNPPPEGDHSTSTGESEGHQPIRQLSEGVERLMRMFIRTRAQMLDRARDDIDWSVQILMGVLVKNGPMRVKKLAELVESDPSTVSRHAAQLVRDGFLERRSDPADGRACQLVATDKARRSVADRTRSRDAHFEEMLHGWDNHDRERLAALLVRFIDDFETYKTALAATDWKGFRPSASQKETTA
ncbi:MarR family transcriptional regulator [Streptomyces sp. NBC_01571]|uniref:MarR family winged helix-turn-helix transcriptional regulator n=1 Tax=Streptomyces sp. NBC_01571 TaxID=2975883 RepID=UPI00224FC6CB|nr:MarR family transcriptional regulator [Streptomyces sp. NBC_01571]MCX4580368.1 MarR family transcriptional regulator [Streptomyces sp. NBC_01571]